MSNIFSPNLNLIISIVCNGAKKKKNQSARKILLNESLDARNKKHSDKII